MPPLRYRDLRAAPVLSNPLIARRIARGLSIDVSICNRMTDAQVSLATDEFESAFAAKEIELARFLSPVDPTPNFKPVRLADVNYGEGCNFCSRFPEVINSFRTFNRMKELFMRYLTENDLGHIVPESILYRSVYLPYG
jgi:hypothetical protein